MLDSLLKTQQLIKTHKLRWNPALKMQKLGGSPRGAYGSNGTNPKKVSMARALQGTLLMRGDQIPGQDA